MPKGDTKEGYLNTNAHLETKVEMLERALAESQAREWRIRTAGLWSIHNGSNEALRAVLSASSDDSALREMIEAAKAEEREACAKVCDGLYQFIFNDAADNAITECAKAIRARKE